VGVVVVVVVDGYVSVVFCDGVVDLGVCYVGVVAVVVVICILRCIYLLWLWHCRCRLHYRRWCIAGVVVLITPFGVGYFVDAYVVGVIGVVVVDGAVIVVVVTATAVGVDGCIPALIGPIVCCSICGVGVDVACDVLL